MMEDRKLNEKLVQSWLDILPAYISFVLKFCKTPRQAFAEVATSGKVSSDLTSILLGGVALAYIIGISAAGPRLLTDRGVILQLLQRIEYRLLPVAAVAAVVVAGLVTHWLTTLAGLWDEDARLGGAVEDTVNAALGFSALFVPFGVALICAVSWTESVVVLLIAATVLGLVFVTVFPVALMAVHAQVTYRHAFGSFSLALVILVIIDTWF